MENLCSQGYTRQTKYLEVKNPGLLRAGIWEEEGSHEDSLFTSVYATEIHDGSRNFLNPQRLNAALFNQSLYSYLCTGCGFCFF